MVGKVCVCCLFCGCRMCVGVAMAYTTPIFGRKISINLSNNNEKCKKMLHCYVFLGVSHV